MMSEKWLFSNHVDVEVVTALLLQSVAIILNAVSALIRVTCYEVVQHSDYVTSRQNASFTFSILSFTRFLRNSVVAEFGQTPGSDRRNYAKIQKTNKEAKTPTTKKPHQEKQRSVITKQNQLIEEFSYVENLNSEVGTSPRPSEINSSSFTLLTMARIISLYRL